MINSVLAIGVAVILLVAIVAAGAYAWHLWRLWQERRKHTRERFLFAALGLLGRSFIAYMAFVFGGAWPITFLASWSSGQTVEFRIAPTPPTEIATLGATTLLICLSILVWKVFKHWHGETSEYERKYGQLTAYEIVSVALLDRDRRRLMRHPARQENDTPKSSLGWSIPGHLRALNLILAYDERYQLSENQWHSEERAFIGRYGTEQEPFIFFYAERLTPDFVDHINKTKIRYAGHRKRVLIEDESHEGFAKLDDVKVVTFEEIMFESHRLREYERALLEELRNKRFGEKSPTIQDMLVPLRAEVRPAGATIPNINSHILEWIAHGDHNEHIALLGEYGQGKSVLSIWLSVLLLRRLVDFQRVPILIPLGGKSPRNTSVEEMIDAWAGRYRINANLARAWVETGHAVIIFDAFDEMDLVGDRTLRLRNFMRIWEFAERPAPRLIITGRPNLFLDTEEMRLALKLASGGAVGHHAKPIYLSKLDREQIGDALREWPASTREGILEAYDRRGGAGSFADLIARPSTLALAASVWPTITDKIGTATIGNTTIIREFLYQTYDRQREKRDRSGLRPLLTTTELSFFMRAISVVMGAKGDSTNRIARSEITVVVETVLADWPTEIARIGDITVEAAPERAGKDLSEWVRNLTDGLSAIATEVAATGVLVEDESNPNMLKMAHKSFYEYLYAEVYVCSEAPDRLHARSEQMTIASLSKQRLSEISLSREVLVFSAELIYLFNLQDALDGHSRKWLEAVRSGWPKGSLLIGIIGFFASSLVCLLSLFAYVADAVWAVIFGVGESWLPYIYSLLPAGLFGLVISIGAVMAGVVFERPEIENGTRVSILCALLYEKSLARILRQMPVERLMVILGRGFTAIEIGQDYRLDQYAFLPGKVILEFSVWEAEERPIRRMAAHRSANEHVTIRDMAYDLGTRRVLLGGGFRLLLEGRRIRRVAADRSANEHRMIRDMAYEAWSSGALFGEGFGFLEADVPSEVATTWLIVRSGNSFSKISEVPQGLTMDELPEYLRARDHKVDGNTEYGVLASFCAVE